MIWQVKGTIDIQIGIGSAAAPSSQRSLSINGTNGNGFRIPYNATYFNQVNNISAFGWFKTSGHGASFGTIFGTGSATANQRKWYFSVFNAKLFCVATGSGSASQKGYTSVADVNDGAWHHVGIKFTTNTFRVWLDGVELTTGAGTLVKTTDLPVASLTAGVTDDIGIGCLPVTTSTNNVFDGLICGFGYFNANLTDGQMAEAYNSGTVMDLTTHSAAANLMAAYPVTSADTASLADNSGNGNTATKYGTVSLSTDVPV